MLPVVILCGGLATRIRPVSEKAPKSLIDINGHPFIDYQLGLLRSNGVEQVVLCVGCMGELIERHVGNGERFGLNAVYSNDGERLLGTGGAIKKALPILSKMGDRFFVLYGDSYLPINYRVVERMFLLSGKRALMTVYRNGGKYDLSNAIYRAGENDGEPGVVELYDKKKPTPGMNYIDYGLTCCDALEVSRQDGEVFDLADVYTGLSREGQLAGFEVHTRFYEIGSFGGMADFRRYAASITSDHQRGGA